ncbi:predicted protein [Uncinocarpus reesii 1704]|uniref:Uncharacterized protein n=1 Tax=Uncinocarpus reesii (strain UAMH 1704) TaxID=336963 RepID=C4JNR9_UNCRE|nr:uncharacterized protein UREG_04389 [Uncinocarpus reesii 1704]EEP79543.1 predicted protein [Uncinocarpus reesii 1704]
MSGFQSSIFSEVSPRRLSHRNDTPFPEPPLEIPDKPFDEHGTGPTSPTRITPGSLLHLKPREHTPSHRPTHRRARTELFLSKSDPFISPGALKDVELHTNEKAPTLKTEQGSKLFAGLFQGESAPIRFGILPSPTKEKDPISGASTPNQSRPSSPTKKMAVPSSLKNIAYSNPFSFFGVKQRKESSNMPEPAEDEYLNLDIDSFLFRPEMSGISPEQDFVNFQRNAEQLVRQLRDAYKQRTFALHQALAEKVEQKEELEETHSRLQMIKSQLNGMAAKALKQDEEMKALAEELRLERQKRQQEREARQASIMLEKRSDELADVDGAPTNTTRRHTKKSSGASISCDSGFESADESVSGSIFSKGTDDTAPTRPPSVISTTFDVPRTPLISTYQPSPARPQSNPPIRPSAYDRVLKGISAAGSSLGHVATILQEENRALKSRITELETAVEECITLVGG